jgi:hypothetical protein
MRILGIFLATVLITASCTTDSETVLTPEEGEQVAKLRNELRTMELEIAEKDSMLNESISTFNEIQENVAKISLKEQEIRIRSGDMNLSEDNKQWIIQEIQNINFLREENIRKVNALNKQLGEKDLKINDLQTLVNRLAEQVQSQEDMIASLQSELADLDREYSRLFDAYMEQSELALETMKELNKVFYVYGSLKELKENNVVVQEGGFIGMGKKTAIKDGFNEDYFTAVDKHKTNKITIVGNKIRLISDHPSSAYSIEDKGATKVITILDAKSFWKISKYLVVVVD